jgi:hypothetical protein
MQIGAAADQPNRAAIELGAEPVLSACFLSAHAYCCEFDDGAIILDLRGDTYVGIDAQHLANLRARIENWPDSDRGDRDADRPDVSASESLIADLIARGILTTSSTSGHTAPAANPTMALAAPPFAEVRRRIRFTHIAHFSIAFVTVTLRLRRNGLASLMDWLRRRQTSIRREHPVSREDTLERLSSFLWLRTWCYTARRRCLFDSLVLSIYLTRGMVPCTIVIGVATKPFLAHSWVQIGEAVLNDTAEHTHDFKPIFSVGGE